MVLWSSSNTLSMTAANAFCTFHIFVDQDMQATNSRTINSSLTTSIHMLTENCWCWLEGLNMNNYPTFQSYDNWKFHPLWNMLHQWNSQKTQGYIPEEVLLQRYVHRNFTLSLLTCSKILMMFWSSLVYFFIFSSTDCCVLPFSLLYHFKFSTKVVSRFCVYYICNC